MVLRNPLSILDIDPRSMKLVYFHILLITWFLQPIKRNMNRNVTKMTFKEIYKSQTTEVLGSFAHSGGLFPFLPQSKDSPFAELSLHLPHSLRHQIIVLPFRSGRSTPCRPYGRY